MSKNVIHSISVEALGLKDTPHPAFYSWLVADRSRNTLPNRVACMVLDDFMKFAQDASRPEKAARNNKDIQIGFSRIARFCEISPKARQYVRRGFTESDKPTDTIPQLVIPVVDADELFGRLLTGELGNTKGRKANTLTIHGLGEKSLQLTQAAMQAVHTQHPDLLHADRADELPPIGLPLLDVGNPDFISRITGMGDILADSRRN